MLLIRGEGARSGRRATVESVFFAGVSQLSLSVVGEPYEPFGGG